jgi:hypothetical protein
MGTTTSAPGGANDSVVDHALTLVRTVASRQVTKRMSEAADRVATFSGTVREIASEVQKRQPSVALANVTDTVVSRIDAVATYLEHTPPERLFTDLRTFGSERPAAAAFAAILVGFGAARIVKVSVSNNA